MDKIDPIWRFYTCQEHFECETGTRPTVEFIELCVC